MADLTKYQALMGRKVYCTTIANENIYQKLTSYNQDYLTFKSITGGELNVPIRNVIYFGTKRTKLQGLFWQE
jgi:hypothetical protein